MKRNFANCQAEIGANMIRILLCDDDTVFLERMRTEIRAVLSKAHVGAVIHTATCAEDIPEELFVSCDLCFLDIDFSGKRYTGMDIAKEIRRVNQNAIIIFLTNYIEYAPQGYEVQAFRYVLKSDVHPKLEQYLLEAINKLSVQRESIQVRISGEPITLYLENIIFVEAMAHSSIIHAKNGDDEDGGPKVYKLYTSLSSMEGLLSDRGFLRIQKSYLVNMRKIKKLRCSEVTLDDGTTLPVSEKTYAEQKEKYLLWKGLG